MELAQDYIQLWAFGTLVPILRELVGLVCLVRVHSLK
jgi:hypothetical protein